MTWLFFLFLLNESAFATPFTLSPQGTITSHFEEQKFAENCIARREYPVIENYPDKTVETRLNERFAKLLTVGKKLTAADCPEKDSKESYRYSNSYVLGQQKGDYLGIRFIVTFPGGSGRVAYDCRIFDLRSGKEIKLKQKLKADGLATIQKIMAKAGKDFDFNEKYDPQGLTPETEKERDALSPFCLEEKNLIVLKSPYDKLFRHIKLNPGEMRRIFKDDPVMAALRKR